MLYWECNRRLHELEQFRGLVEDYFQSLGMMPGSRRTVQTHESVVARNKINVRLRDALDSCNLIGETTTVFYSPPPAFGGFQGRLNLLLEIFNLRDYRIPPARVIDTLDRAIGVYRHKSRTLFWKTFNPFYWLYLLLVKVIGIPFQILGAAGFDSAKLENSIAGKTVKAVVGFVVFTAAFLTVLQILGLLEPVLKLVHGFAR